MSVRSRNPVNPNSFRRLVPVAFTTLADFEALNGGLPPLLGDVQFLLSTEGGDEITTEGGDELEVGISL